MFSVSDYFPITKLLIAVPCQHNLPAGQAVTHQLLQEHQPSPARRSVLSPVL